MDDTLYDLALQAMIFGLAEGALTSGSLRRSTEMIASNGFARTEEISNAAFASSLYGLLSLMQAPAPRPARPLSARKDTASLTTQMTLAQPLAVS